ncbi:MAG TPA: thioredoxin domain-containing protein [Anaerolineales bacterium]
MSKKDREGQSKRQEFREKRRQAEQRNRWIWIGLIIVGALLVAFVLIYPQLKPVAAIQTAAARSRPNVNRNSSGDPNAPVKLTEFADFQCPYCKEYWTTTEPQIFDTYVKTGKVLYTYRSAGNWVSGNIGGGGVESQDSAMAAYCAADQNKFWEMHDALFTNVLGEDAGSFTNRRLQVIAQSIGLDMNAYNSCYNSQKYLSQVNQDFTDAQASGIQGTPWFVVSYTVNGQAKTATVDGNQPFSAFQQTIDQALAAVGAK